jgi:hypothetical protein
MHTIYGGSENEASFTTTTFIRLLVEMGYLEKKADGTYALIK